MSINFTLVGQIISFALFTVFCMKYVWPPMMAVMQERRRQIEEGLQRSKDADQELESAKSEADQLRNNAKSESQKLLEDARVRSQQLVDAAKEKAQEEADKTLAHGKEVLQQEIVKAQEILKQELAGLVVSGVSTVTSGGMNEDANAKVIQDVLQSVGVSNGITKGS